MTSKSSVFDVIVIGAGAAGLFCAAQAGKRGKNVLVLDHADTLGKKILVSGGGRCNFTNMHISPDNYLSHNKHFCKSALNQYTQWDFIALVDAYGISYHEKLWSVPQVDGSVHEVGQGQLFCDTSAKDILTMLVAECEKYAVHIRTQCTITGIEQGFRVNSSLGDFYAEQCVIATGGLSFPKMGASNFAYKIAEQFGLKVLPTKAGLVPFVFTDHHKAMFEGLSGVSQFVHISNDKADFLAPLLFTHRGLSGPASLQLSNYWGAGEHFRIDLLAHMPQEYLLDLKRSKPKLILKNALQTVLSKPLTHALQHIFWSEYAQQALHAISNDVLRGIEHNVRNWHIKPAGTEGYRKAEVTMGGVDTDELSSKTMEAKKVPGLYFIGEAVDVTGWLGGYNFQWAWSTGFVAAQNF